MLVMFGFFSGQEVTLIKSFFLVLSFFMEIFYLSAFSVYFAKHILCLINSKTIEAYHTMVDNMKFFIAQWEMK